MVLTGDGAESEYSPNLVFVQNLFELSSAAFSCGNSRWASVSPDCLAIRKKAGVGRVANPMSGGITK
jgi:hypothetical protein